VWSQAAMRLAALLAIVAVGESSLARAVLVSVYDAYGEEAALARHCYRSHSSPKGP
jgi:hypothetical protein